MTVFYMLNTFYLSSFFPCVTLIKYVSSYRKIGPSCLLSENDDLSFLLFFSKQRLVENIQGKFQKNSLVTLISEESP